MKYKVFRRNYLNLEYYLNKWYQEFPNYHLCQIFYEPNSTSVVVIFEHDDIYISEVQDDEQAD